MKNSIDRSLVSNPLWSRIRIALCFAMLVGLASCTADTNVQTPPANTSGITTPTHFPPVVTPADNPYTPEKATLGRYLFYEKRMSSDNSVACADCHKQSGAFSDFGHATSKGVNGIILDSGRGKPNIFGTALRNAPGLANVAYNFSYFWDGRASTLETQALMPIRNPAEMNNSLAVIVKRLGPDTLYQRLCINAFGDASIDSIKIAKALATFERTLISGNSPYDAYLNGDKTALTASAIRGLALFDSSATNCSRCHSGFNFADSGFHSTGLDQSYASDSGRFTQSHSKFDVGKFKTPSLRNVALTAPYEHDGRFSTLEQVLNHYNQGGAHNPQQDSLIKPMHLSNQQIEDIIAFMNSLTDQQFASDPRFSAP